MAGLLLQRADPAYKCNLDIVWLWDESLATSDNLPDPDVIAADIIENLHAALEQFAAINTGLGEGTA